MVSFELEGEIFFYDTTNEQLDFDFEFSGNKNKLELNVIKAEINHKLTLWFKQRDLFREVKDQEWTIKEYSVFILDYFMVRFSTIGFDVFSIDFKNNISKVNYSYSLKSPNNSVVELYFKEIDPIHHLDWYFEKFLNLKNVYSYYENDELRNICLERKTAYESGKDEI